jgi:DNA repair protein RadA/Sms
MGRCGDCGQYGTFVEETEAESARATTRATIVQPQQLSEVETLVEERFSTAIAEFDRVLGGGVVPGSLVLIGGEPGIGKSTLLLQVANNVAEQGSKALLVTGEESPRQVRMRADRLGALSENLYLLPEIDIERIEARVRELEPSLLVIDSIQTLYDPGVTSAPGSVSQVRECTARLMRLAKEDSIPTFIVGHVTKDGAIAGPRVLEHMVDTVLYFEGDSHYTYRLVRAVKNRFGSTNELGIFEMKGGGLEPVANPSALFLAQRPPNVAGSVVVAAVEGSRPLLLEVQALVSRSYANMPRRLSTGIDYNRMLLILAVLERRCGLHFEEQDVFVNVAGGLRATEPAADLGVALALASALKERPVGHGVVAFGEIGLTGEVRFVGHADRRLAEADKLGFTQAVLPAQEVSPQVPKTIELVGAATAGDAIAAVLG